MTDPLALPSRPVAADPPPFPLLAAVAPLLVAGALFAVTRAPEVLLFAAFSPVLALAGVVDGRLGARRRLRREQQRRCDALDVLRDEVDARVAGRVADLRRRYPGSAVLVAEPAAWRARPPTGTVVLGTGDQRIEPLVRGTPADAIEAALIENSSVLPGVPVTVPADTTVAVVGPPQLTAPVARAIALQRLRGLGRHDPPVEATGPDGQDADVVLAVESCTTARVAHATGPHAHLTGRVLTPCFVTAVAQQQVLAGVGGAPLALSDVVLDGDAGQGLAARFLVDGGEPVELDLVRDGPHAVVGGTTGSGKSALLTAWVLALAAAHAVERLQLLLVDCKGGAAFDALRDLPQVAGVVTDLDPAGATRAIAGLTAELVRRERALREAAAPDVAATDLPRLVIVVDEFRTLLERAPGLADVFVDIGARGRSLGVHLILCTQRPAGALGTELLANCGLRIALRVHDAADSIALVGTPAAAALARHPGSALLAVPGERPTAVRVADLGDGAVAAAVVRIGRSRAGGRVPPRPWLDPLPPLLPLPQLRAEHAAASGAPGEVVLGRLDLPAEQRQPLLTWDPGRQPRLLVLGDSGSGRSTLLAVVAEQCEAVLLSEDGPTAWDQLRDDGTPLLIDGLERLLDVLAPAAATAMLERLIVRLRRPDAEPTVLALHGPASWGGAPLRPLLGLADRTLVLRLGRDDHLAITGDRTSAGEALPAGGGWWRGARVQVAHPSTRPMPTAAVVAAPLTSTNLLLVSAAPAARSAALRAAGFHVTGPDDLNPSGLQVRPPAGAAGTAVVGGVDGWQARWSLLSRLRATGTLVTDGLSPAEFRVITGRSEVPPPVSHPDDVLLVPTEGPVVRRRLPPSVRRPAPGPGSEADSGALR